MTWNRQVPSVTQIHAGAAYNVVPETAKLCGTIRYFKDAVYETALSRMEALCRGIAEAYGVKIILNARNVFEVLNNDGELSDAYLEAAADIVGAENISNEAAPATGSEDFADLLKFVPGSYCRLGHTGTIGLHNPSFVLGQEILPVGASIMARVVERRLHDGGEAIPPRCRPTSRAEQASTRSSASMPSCVRLIAD